MSIHVKPRLNIVTQLLALVLVAIAIGQANAIALFCLFCFFLSANALHKRTHFFKLARRLKWFFIVMWIIYAFNTPGEHWQKWPFIIAPTLEGMQAGGAQLLRILVMLSALSLMFACNNREQQVSGFYFLLKPLQWVGFDIERFAARLWLTMHYVETQPSLVRGPHYVDFIRQAVVHTVKESGKPHVIQWVEPVFTVWDIGLAFLMVGMTVLLVVGI